MLYGHESVIYFVEQNGPLWAIKMRSSGKLDREVFSYKPDPQEADKARSITQLREVLQHLNGRYVISAGSQKLDGNAGKYEEFTISPQDQQAQQINGFNQATANPAGLAVNVEQTVNEKVETELMKRELAALKDNQYSINGFQKAVIDFVGTLKMFTPVITQYLQAKNNKPAAQVAGLNNNEMSSEKQTPEMTDQEFNTALSEQVSRLASVDSNILSHLKKLADMGENNPNQFNMLLGMLDNM